MIYIFSVLIMSVCLFILRVFLLATCQLKKKTFKHDSVVRVIYDYSKVYRSSITVNYDSY